MRTTSEVKAFLDGSEQLSSRITLRLASAEPLAAKEPQLAADAVVTSFGFAPIGRLAWCVLSTNEAAELLKKMLHRSLAYHQELLSLKSAEYAAHVLVESLSRYNSHFLANGSINSGSADWTPIGTATFEMAVVGYDEAQAFLLYAEDED